MKKIIIGLVLIIASSTSFAQQINRFNPDTIRTIVIDSLVDIKSHKLNAQDFIDAVLADTSFYKAFQNMKRYGFTAENRIFTYDKKNKVDGKIYRKIKHTSINGHHQMEYLAKKDSGSIYKKD